MTRWLTVAAVAVVLSGCVMVGGSGGTTTRISWAQSSKYCNNDACTYGRNAQVLTSSIRCGPDVTVTWTVHDRIAGYVDVQVFDPTRTTRFDRPLATDTQGSESLRGTTGKWTLEGHTHDANGQWDVRLTCGASPSASS